MNSLRFKIKDECRQNLCKYLSQAVSILPPIEKPIIIDLGCGTGAPTLNLTQHFNGVIFAVDSSQQALGWLNEKLLNQQVSSTIILVNKLVDELQLPSGLFDIVLAEGLLNIIGFEKGLELANGLIKMGGYFIIHDEYKNHSGKLEMLKSYGYEVINTIMLGSDIWWNDYYKGLEEKIDALDSESKKEFGRELNEIDLYKKQPEQFNSIYYIAKKPVTNHNIMQSYNHLLTCDLP